MIALSNNASIVICVVAFVVGGTASSIARIFKGKEEEDD